MLATQPVVTDQQNQQALSARSAPSTDGSPTPNSVEARDLANSGADDSRPSIDPEEFERFLEHAAGLCDDETRSLRSWLELAEAWQITRCLRRCRGNRSATARELGIGRRTLYAKMEKLGITATWGI